MYTMSMHDGLYKWLTGLRNDFIRMEPLTGDASFRHYYRVFCTEGTSIVVDASYEKRANLQFAKIAEHFLASGLQVPKILAADFKLGFLLLSDFGDQSYLTVLTHPQTSPALRDTLYQTALSTLQILQQCSLKLPLYSKTLLQQELSLFTDWFLIKHLGLNLNAQREKILSKIYLFLIEQAMAQPFVCVHRDYHSRNLMVIEKNNPGILDFQDAVLGPITYDCVSLLRDCYIKWPDVTVSKWLGYFFEASPCRNTGSFEQFSMWFDWMGFQRHLKAIGIFARLWHRDHKDAYLKDIPRTLSYLLDLCKKHSLLKDFKLFLETNIPEIYLCQMPSFLQQAVVSD